MEKLSTSADFDISNLLCIIKNPFSLGLFDVAVFFWQKILTMYLHILQYIFCNKKDEKEVVD